MPKPSLGLFAVSLISNIAFAASLETVPVGNFGGARIWISCSFSGQPEAPCLLDTGSGTSIAVDQTSLPVYTIVGHKSLGGLGGVQFDCPIISVPDFKFGGQTIQNVDFLRCAEFGIGDAAALIGRNILGAQSFLLDPVANVFDWNPPTPAKVNELSREEGWLGISGHLGPNPLRIGFDTGAPITLISSAWVEKHPEFFAPSDLPLSAGLAAAKVTAYRLKTPIEVDGVLLDAPYIHAVDLGKFASLGFDLLLGENHIATAQWYFDLSSNRWAVTAGKPISNQPRPNP